MKISKKTMAILENFSIINKSICINEQGYLKNISEAKNIIGLAKIEEELPNFSIYDLTEFCQVIKMFDIEKDVDFTFTDKEVIIKQGKTKVNYRFCHPDHIYNKCDNYEKYTSNTDYVASFSLNKETMDGILKASKIMSLGTINIGIDDSGGEISLFDEDNSAANQYRIEIEGQGNCDVNLDTSLFTFIKGDYDVFVYPKYVKFVFGDVCYILLNKEI